MGWCADAPQHEGFVVAICDAGALSGRVVRNLMGFTWPTPALSAWNWVYIARNEAGIMKIGLSHAPTERIPTLGRTKFWPVGIIPLCNERHERALCKIFSGLESRGKEWFIDCPSTRSFVWFMAGLRDRGKAAVMRAAEAHRVVA